MKTGVYTITNLIDNKIYVGCSLNMSSRKTKHFNELMNNIHSNHYLQNSYNKYGKDNFLFEILVECDKDFLFSEENYWCNMLNVHNKNYGYNIAPTNPDNKKVYSQETILKLKNKYPNRRGVKLSQFTIDKIRESKLNTSQETKDKISKSLKLWNFNNISPSLNFVRSIESKMKMSKSALNRTDIRIFKERSEKTKKMLSINNCQNISVISLKNGEFYYNLSFACRELKLTFINEWRRLKNGKSEEFKYKEKT